MEQLEQLKLILETGENASGAIVAYCVSQAIGPVLGFTFGVIVTICAYKLIGRAIIVYNNGALTVLEKWANKLNTKAAGPISHSEQERTIRAIDELVDQSTRKE